MPALVWVQSNRLVGIGKVLGRPCLRHQRHQIRGSNILSLSLTNWLRPDLRMSTTVRRILVELSGFSLMIRYLWLCKRGSFGKIVKHALAVVRDCGLCVVDVESGVCVRGVCQVHEWVHAMDAHHTQNDTTKTRSHEHESNTHEKSTWKRRPATHKLFFLTQLHNTK